MQYCNHRFSCLRGFCFWLHSVFRATWSCEQISCRPARPIALVVFPEGPRAGFVVRVELADAAECCGPSGLDGFILRDEHTLLLQVIPFQSFDRLSLIRSSSHSQKLAKAASQRLGCMNAIVTKAEDVSRSRSPKGQSRLRGEGSFFGATRTQHQPWLYGRLDQPTHLSSCCG
jgi:hypothetical protein